MRTNAGTPAFTGEAPLKIDVVRSDFVESVHFADGAGTLSDGEIAFEFGDSIGPKSLRSAIKPLQVLAMMRHGLPLTGELLALAVASHSGEGFHVEGVREILRLGRLNEDDLQCPQDWPYDSRVAERYIASGQNRSRIRMNCSGKHAAMLLTCVINGWPIGSYLEPSHPLQLAISNEIREACSEEVARIGIDGCGAPLFFMSLGSLSSAYHSMVIAEISSHEGKIADAIESYPEWTSGSNRIERRVMATTPGLIVKTGAEGVVALAHRDGRSSVFKVIDGANRAIPPLIARGLRAMGLATDEDNSILSSPILGGDRTVGEIVAR